MSEQLSAAAQAAPAAYPKPPRTCEIVSGEDGQPGAMVKCAHCGVPFKTTAWNWQRRSFVARKCQDAIREAKAASGVAVTRKPRRDPAAVALGNAARTAQTPPDEGAGGDMMWASPECGRPKVFRSDMAETFREGSIEPTLDEWLSARTPAGARVYDFKGGDRAREGRKIARCPVCGERAEEGEPTPTGGAVYHHELRAEPDQRRGAQPGAVRHKRVTWCVTYEDGREALSFVKGRPAGEGAP